MSLSQIIILGNWLLEGNLKRKLSNFLKNKVAPAVSVIVFTHLIGLLYTQDFNYGLEDVKKKLPLLLLPLIFSTSPALSLKTFNTILKLFIAAVFVGTLISIAVLNQIIPREINTIRDISIFISHIRFSLLICTAIFMLGYLLYQNTNKLYRIFYSGLIIWLFIFLIILESLTGLAILFIIGFLIFVYFLFILKSIKFKVISLTAFIAISTGIFLFSKSIVKDYNKVHSIDFKSLEKQTEKGNFYVHDTLNTDKENGYFIWINLCEPELESAWNNRSDFKYAGKDKRGNDIKYTLIRFLTSKGEKKDAKGVNSLTEKEIKSIENGIANVNHQSISDLRGRVYETIWEINEYIKRGNATGYSVSQRFEFWKAAIGIIKENPLTGVGTGDAKIAYAEQYDKMNSTLAENYRLRAHNQYLAVAVSTGIIGLLIFISSLFYPIIKNRLWFDYLYITFFLIATISMFAEDTLETQAGITFFAFFNSLLLFAKSNNLFSQNNQRNL